MTINELFAACRPSDGDDEDFAVWLLQCPGDYETETEEYARADAEYWDEMHHQYEIAIRGY